MISTQGMCFFRVIQTNFSRIGMRVKTGQNTVQNELEIR
jgi:hypothetical protein